MALKPAKFVREVKREASKVTWATRKETTTTTIIVVIMVLLAALFFWLADSVLFTVIYEYVLGISDK